MRSPSSPVTEYGGRFETLWPWRPPSGDEIKAPLSRQPPGHTPFDWSQLVDAEVPIEAFSGLRRGL